MMKKTIAILTGGGDCPGLNATIRAITKSAIIDNGWNVLGFCDGYFGLIEKKVRKLSYSDVSNILSLGGTILGTSNKANPFQYFKTPKKAIDVSAQVVRYLKKLKVDTLFCIGGDGTLSIANRLQKKWPHVIGIPKTIDNDLSATDQTFGFNTACSFVTEAIDRIHSTAQSHHRVMVIEVMGRYAGWIALGGGLAGGGDVILIPEMPFSYDKIEKIVLERSKKGKRFTIIVAAEGAHPINEELVVRDYIKDSPDPIRLGGIAEKIASEIEKRTGLESRYTVLGHLQRGGAPTFFDRVLATTFGVTAVKLAEENNFGKMVAYKNGKITAVTLEKAVAKLKLVSKDHPLIKVAKSVGTSFGV